MLARVPGDPHEAPSAVETIAKLCRVPLSRGRERPYHRRVTASTAAAPATVLVVDDEPMVREVVARYLELDGHRVVEVADGDDGLAWLDANQPDLVVLDVMLPGTDGLTILRRLRERSQVPVLLLTARTEEVDRIAGLEMGADDYVVKPFSAREVAARVRTILRRSAHSRADADVLATVVEHEGLRIDTASRTVEAHGAPVALTAKEFDLLTVLASSPRQVFSRRQLLDQVWDSAPEYQDPATVTVHVGRLRQKLERDPDHPSWIVTVWGVGYRFEP
jgi:DNA-binding response OmpR family regulator